MPTLLKICVSTPLQVFVFNSLTQKSLNTISFPSFLPSFLSTFPTGFCLEVELLDKGKDI